MKKTILLSIILLSFLSVSAQTYAPANSPKVYVPSAVTTDWKGGSLSPGDTIAIPIYHDPDNARLKNVGGQGFARRFFMDFQYSNIDYSFINFYPVTGVGSAVENIVTLSSNNPTVWYNNYSNFRFNETSSNNTWNGLTRYQYSSYVTDNTNNIFRGDIAWVTNGNNSVNLKPGVVAVLVLKLKDNGFIHSYTNLKYNFTVTYDNLGYSNNTNNAPIREIQLQLGQSPILVQGRVYKNSNMPYYPSIEVKDPNTNVVITSVQPDENGFYQIRGINYNSQYKLNFVYPFSDVQYFMNYGTTISDVTATYNEMVNQNQPGGTTNYTNLFSGISWLSADVRSEGVVDLGTAYAMLANVVGAGTYNEFTNSKWHVLETSDYNSLTPTNWTTRQNWGTERIVNTTNVAITKNYSYYFIGDVNRSLSSPAFDVNGNTIYGRKSTLSGYNGIMAGSLEVSTTPIDVSLNDIKNITNTIEIPFVVDTKDQTLNGLQFEVTYNPSVLKFKEMKVMVGDNWVSFANADDVNGFIKFGSFDKDLKGQVKGIVTPFSLVFESINNPVDLKTAILVSNNMDAVDSKGNQLPIKINTQTIKLYGLNR
jgi:hypothetical protein